MLDVTLPDINGLELQKRVAVDRVDMPIIFISGHGDVPMTVQAMKAGAVEFLTKPLGGEALLNAIRDAIERSSTVLAEAEAMRSLRDCHASLTLSRTAGHGVGRLRPVEQAGRRRTRHQRDHGEGTPGQHDAKDAGQLACASREHGREARHRASRSDYTLQIRGADMARHARSARHSRPAGSWIADHPNVKAYASTPGSRNSISNV